MYPQRGIATFQSTATADLGIIAYVTPQLVCMIVVEGVMEELATEVTKSVAPPVIGIGASAACDGQILVTDDMLGMFERTPRFVKRYDDLAERIGKAAESYAAEVRSRSFPGTDQTYRPKPR